MGPPEFTTKHEQIIQYIEELLVGTKISVRKIAQTLEVSEGTAYRAIKDAETRGIVSTKERTGTVRVEKEQRQHINRLTFAEIVKMVDGEVLGGAAGLQKTLSKFVIGAMQVEAMMRYIEPGNLLIVGNRNKAHYSALTLGAGVLITGGFNTTEDVKALADELELPIISSGYDTFTVAALINRAIYDRLIKKQIVLVGDIVRLDLPLAYMRKSDTVEDVLKRIEETNHNRFPVVDDNDKPIGMITTKDLIGAPGIQSIDKIMTRNPLTVTMQTSVATAGHMMVWEAIELLPVIDGEGKLSGVISRKDVLKAMQNIQMQPQSGETLENQIWSAFQGNRDDHGRLYYRGVIDAHMSNQVGNLSEGILASLINQVVTRTMKEHRRGDLHIDSTSVYYLAPVEIEDTVDLFPTVIESSRRFCKVEVEVSVGDKRVAQAMITARVFDQP
ncbi:DRTGG domain-containing protein [Paenibacillus mendelii]|uniref:DRTGG domain-containing protein n=1 Tax=Paenibacillus mendelii TaxID=206163 RepID=A0ABV6JJE4_9BACL|nr:DRTGG domain-containing protein [Paenibacillus mendelii]MCQ6558964.1 DRTGG domain-containing protein [Paenibacillus mendelii]